MAFILPLFIEDRNNKEYTTDFKIKCAVNDTDIQYRLLNIWCEWSLKNSFI